MSRRIKVKERYYEGYFIQAIDVDAVRFYEVLRRDKKLVTICNTFEEAFDYVGTILESAKESEAYSICNYCYKPYTLRHMKQDGVRFYEVQDCWDYRNPKLLAVFMDKDKAIASIEKLQKRAKEKYGSVI